MFEEIAKNIADTVHETIEFRIKELSAIYEARIAVLEKRVEPDYQAMIEMAISELPKPADGKSFTLEDAKPLIQAAVDEIKASIPAPVKGDKGDSVTIEDIRPLLDSAVAVLPKPLDGKSFTLEDAKPVIEAAINEIKSAIPEPIKGDKGDSVTIDDMKPLLEKAVSELPKPKEAEVDYGKVKSIVDGIISEAVSRIEIPLPKDGEDGKDAVDMEILPEIDESKSYARSTYASHKGGLWRSYEKTIGMRGWECIVDGLANIDVSYDGERKACVRIEQASGVVVEKELTIPAVIAKGVWREGNYTQGDFVQLSGSSWLAVKDTSERPGDASGEWILAAKQGGTGKSAYDIAKQAGFVGTKDEWLSSLGNKKPVKI